jgi:hypothetical protein
VLLNENLPHIMLILQAIFERVSKMGYEDPDAQAVHRGIYNGSIEQAAARAPG